MSKEKAPYILLAVLAIILGIIIFNFYIAFPFRSNSQDSWLNTAAIINGLVTPILTSFSIILIWMTWQTSKKELNATNGILELDKAIKILSVMMETTNKILNTNIPYSQSQYAIQIVLGKCRNKQYGVLNYYQSNDDGVLFKESVKLLEDILNIPMTHMNFIESGLGSLTYPTSHEETSDFLKKAVIYELKGMYHNEIEYEDLPRPIKKLLKIFDFINMYNDREIIKDTLIDLFLCNIDDKVLDRMKINPFIKNNEIFIEACNQ
ncbi:hypothetical protein [Pseudoalteromonas sp. KAN5]|uniref:hypothetical protein n=1 Tax=Pseudoalteromonas sp. KAN5 TaxID=2916633 RepID=UPI001FCBE3C5|nr:hypothetical protein [Pseudoalteromonas sp. KAN5]BDF94318.1 hypothetical protein KAN5_11560 [Pseudoalteromonas sp. KAN5]